MVSALLEEPGATTPAVLGDDQPERRSMKLVACIIRPESLEAVKEALNVLQFVGGMTITEVRGFGRQKGQVEHYRGGAYTVRFLPKVKVEVAVREEHVEPVLATIARAARTGHVGDGKVFVMDMRHAVRIRTGETGASVL